MSTGVNFMHSHSALERDLKFPKKYVLIDTKYANKFQDTFVKPFTYRGKDFCKVHTYEFWRRGGVFKDLKE